MSTAVQGSHAVDGVMNVMSVDVEDYFHVSNLASVVPRDRWSTFPSRVERNTERLLEMFDAARITATFFVLGWVAERHRALVRKIAESGHEVASHGHGHELVYAQTPSAFREDVRRSKRLLEDSSGQMVEGYRAPSFSITPRSLWAFDVLVEEGYRYDASVYPIHHDRYGIPDAPRHAYAVRGVAGSLLEVPGSTVRIGSINLPIGGGGYFRLLPYAWTRWGIGRVNRVERRPAVFYLHPWEIDPGQPRLPAGLIPRFRHYRNLHRTEARLQRLLSEFRFGPMRCLVDGHSDNPLPRPAALSASR